MPLISFFEIIGTVAFAVSGALVAIRKGLDFFGITILSITTAVGGGIIRDVIIGNTPPIAFREPVYVLVSICCAFFVIIFYRRFERLKNIILLFDAIGLGAFTAIGANLALQCRGENLFLAVSLGVMTGVGGGILRDIFANEIPLVFRKEIYAVASIIGGTVLVLLRNYIGVTAAMYICFCITLIVRLIAIKYDIHLPVLR